MGALKDTLKASIWGVLLLVLVIFVSTAAFVAFDKTGQFYTSSKITEYKKTNAVINEALKDLEQYMSENEYKEHWSAYRDKTVTVIEDFIKKGIDENCHTDCHVLYFSTPTNSYEVENFRSKLERLIDNKETSDANKIVAFTFVMSLLTILFSIYLITALFRYKKLTANGLAVLVLLNAPFLLTSACFATVVAGEYMEFKIKDGAFYTIAACVAYLFIIFPPVILISKKRGYNIIKIIKLDGYI